MRRICAWCQLELSPSDCEPDDGEVSHGICPECADFFTRGALSLSDFLDQLTVPVLALDSQGEVVAANDAARERAGVGLPTANPVTPGDILECANARLPDGCGHTVHCRACTLRLCVEDTYATGTSHDGVPAINDRVPIDDTQPVRYRVSTRKQGDVVLLRIDDV